MENLTGNLRKSEEILEEIILKEVKMGIINQLCHYITLVSCVSLSGPGEPVRFSP